MRLVSARVRNCFGFVDSGPVRLGREAGLYYLLGRNSSGKTSLLTALEHLSPHLQPSAHPRFRNFNTRAEAPTIEAELYVPADVVDHSSLLGRFEGMLGRLGLAAIRDHGLKNSVRERLMAIASEFLEAVAPEGQELELCVKRNAEGGYSFYSNGAGPASAQAILGEFQRKMKSITSDGAFKSQGGEVRTQLHLASPFHLLAEEVIQVFRFSEHYELGADLPDRLTEEGLSKPENELTAAFVRFLGQDAVSRLLASEDPEERDGILTRLQERANALSRRINLAQERQYGSKARLLALRLSEKAGLQVTVKVDQGRDEKKCYYRLLSENTKFLFAYYVHLELSGLEDAVILFDEPSKGFHPTAEAQILEFLKELVREDNQVLVATHSSRLIDPDLIKNVRVMSADSSGHLTVLNGASARGRDQEALALQPLLDAIGAPYVSSWAIQDGCVFLEGLTDYLYIRGASVALRRDLAANLVPARSASHIGKLIPFAIASGYRFKIAADKGEDLEAIRTSYLVPQECVFEVPPPTSHPHLRRTGIEDLFSKRDYLTMVEAAGITVQGAKALKAPNSQVLKDGCEKARVAQEFLRAAGEGRIQLDAESERGFAGLLDFIAANHWYCP